MRKSLIVISALGLAACCMLSVLMRQLVDADAGRREAPFLPALQAQFGARLQQPLRLRQEAATGGPRWIATVQVAAGTDLERLAEALGSEVWLHAQRAGRTPSAVLVRAYGEAKGEVTTVSVPCPQPLR